MTHDLEGSQPNDQRTAFTGQLGHSGSRVKICVDLLMA
jgi:hypothetical protein